MKKHHNIILVARLNPSLTAAEIANHVGAGLGYVYTILRAAGIKPPRPTRRDAGYRGENYQRVIELRQNKPEMAAIDMARQLGISRERVRQILNTAGLRTTRHDYGKSTKLCACGKVIQAQSKRCRECQKAEHRSTLICSECGREFERRNNLIRASKRNPSHGERVFCGKPCQGKWLGRNYGVGRGHHNNGG